MINSFMLPIKDKIQFKNSKYSSCSKKICIINIIFTFIFWPIKENIQY